MKKTKLGFTLIELLIVVLIIAILAAIAIPNFLEFQTRAKVSRVKSDMRTIATGLEAYIVDDGTYPAIEQYYISSAGMNLMYYQGLHRLTTPIAYITNIPNDAFGTFRDETSLYSPSFEFGCGKAGHHASGSNTYPNDTWMLESAGPDNLEDTNMTSGIGSNAYPWPGNYLVAADEPALVGMFYDPTNGTVSRGQIYRTGGVPPPERLGTLFYNLAKN